ncbi:hypothetical protein Vadar_024654 [Vaccinium darrowii]|uniref:Uncharacterized protein n=1 Tax=Vaccinium darrowii TaxID=229202 RepID=A0ACB7ZE36_9ERIC|nr:hypothetical protein Vadar_024654 [Vaccinium darrowii]
MLMNTSWTDRNPGRRFKKCTKPKCKGFDWLDPPMFGRSVQIIPGLLRRINAMEKEIEERKAAERKIKKWLVATWIIVLAVVYGKFFSF